MKTLDRYILKKFLGAFFFVVLILVSVVVVINITERNDSFIKHSLGFREILGYYLDYIPFVANLITPITVFIATVFVTAKLAGRTEIVAMLSSGISFRRLMRPYLIGSIIIAAISFVLNGWIIPNSNKTRVAFEIEYFRRPFYFSERDIHIRESPNSYIYLESYNNRVDVGYRFTMETVEEEGEDVLLKEKLSAKKIEWQEDSASWLIQDWMLRTFDGENEIITKGEEIDTTLTIHPRDFSNSYRMFEALTINELNTYINDLKARGAAGAEPYMIEKYTKYMSPFTVIILTMIGLIVSSRKTRGGSGFQIALGFLIAFIYIIFFIMSKAIAENGSMNMILAIWSPNIIFAIVGLLLYHTVPR